MRVGELSFSIITGVCIGFEYINKDNAGLPEGAYGLLLDLLIFHVLWISYPFDPEEEEKCS